MGTFIIKPTGVASNNMLWTNNSGSLISTSAQILAAMSDQFSGTHEISTKIGAGPFGAQTCLTQLLCSGACIYLDGSGTPVDINGLPAGFTPTSLTLNGPPRQILTGDGSASFNLTYDAFTIGPPVTDPFVWPKSNIPSIISILANGMGMNGIGTASSSLIVGSTGAQTGTYLAGNYAPAFGLGNIVLPKTTNIKAGDKFIINNFTGAGAAGLGGVGGPGTTGIAQILTPNQSPGQVNNCPQGGAFLGIEHILVAAYDSSGILLGVYRIQWDVFIDRLTCQIAFTWPQVWFDAVTAAIVGVGIGIGIGGEEPPDPGVQFYGEVFLGTVTVAPVNSSGMYQLVPGQAYDTVYDRSMSGATKNVPIIDPFIDTAFIP
jgi:hypothetical protein